MEQMDAAVSNTHNDDCMAEAALVVHLTAAQSVQPDSDVLQRLQHSHLQHINDLQLRRWCIVRHQEDLAALSATWWERCGVSAAICKGAHWSNLRVDWLRTRPSQQRSADTMSSAELRTATEPALRNFSPRYACPMSTRFTAAS